MVRKIIVFFIVAFIMILGGCKNNTVDNTLDETHIENNESENNKENDEEDSSEIVEVDDMTIKKMGDKIRITANGKSKYMSPFRHLKWLEDGEFIFSYSKNVEGKTINSFYNFNGENEEIEKLFQVDKELYDSTITYNNGLLYSNNYGFDGLYYLDPDGNTTQIAKKHGWYNISPDGKRVIINGLALDDEDDTQFKRYIFDIEKNSLIETDFIPDMDYVFSNIAATWSPSSIHISSQKGGKEDSLRVVNAIENIITKEITSPEDKISSVTWSPDGKKLGFLVQSKIYSKFIDSSDGEYIHYLSDKIGIYDIEKDTLIYKDLEYNLAVRSIAWNKDGKGIFVITTPLDKIDKYLDKTLDSKVEYAIKHLKLDKNQISNIFKGEAVIRWEGDIRNIDSIPIMMKDDTLVYQELQYPDFFSIVKKYNIVTEKKEELFESKNYIQNSQTSISYDGNLILNTQEGIMLIDKELEGEVLFDFNSYLEEDVSFVRGSLSPDLNNVIVNVIYDWEIDKKNFMDIVNIKK